MFLKLNQISHYLTILDVFFSYITHDIAILDGFFS